MKAQIYFLFALVSVSFPALAQAADGRVNCPIIVDRETGKFTSSKTKYYCYENSKSAKKKGFSKFSYSDDSCHAGGDDSSPGTGLSLAGPGEKRSVVFTAASGGTVQYSFPGAGEFQISVMNASNDRRIERIVEASSAISSSTPFSAQTAPVYIKVEGPGAWTATISIN